MKEDQERINGIEKRLKNADLGPLRAQKSEFGYHVVEPYGSFGRYHTLIASYLDGFTAAFLAQAPDDIRFLLRHIRELESPQYKRSLKKLKRKKRK